MENTNITTIILSSSIAIILSAIVSVFVSIKLKNLDYKNEYYKKILEKRLDAYKFLEAQIAVLKSSVLDEDRKSYYLIFAYGIDKYYEFQQDLFAALSYSMWINDETVNKMEKLNELFFNISRKINNISVEELIIIGKDNYHEIAKQRKSLEICVRNDLINLYNLKDFRKSKKLNRLRTIKIEE